MGFPGNASGKESACQCRRHRDIGSIPGSTRPPGGGHGNPLQYSCLKNPIDRAARWALDDGITELDMTAAAAAIRTVTTSWELRIQSSQPKYEEKQQKNSQKEKLKDHKYIYNERKKFFKYLDHFRESQRKKRLHVKDWKYKAQGKGIKWVTLKCLNMSQ